MRRLLFLLAALLFAAPAHAFPLRGASSSCVFTGSTTVGSCINFANLDILSTTDGTNWQFTTATNLQLSGAVSSNITIVDEAIFCHSGTYDQGSVTVHSSDTLAWWAVYFDAYQQQPVPCSTTNYFLINGTPALTFFQACTTAPTSASVEIKPNPNGPWIGIDPSHGADGGCTIGSSGVTFTLDPGTTISTPYTANGAAGIQLNGANQTLVGVGATICCQTFSEVNEIIDAVTNNAPNPTIEGALGNPLVIDCNAGSNGPTGILTGPVPSGTADIVTITHVVVKRCGTDGGGQNHGIYIGWGTGSSGNTAYCESLTDVVVRDAGGDTNSLKVDTTCGVGQGSINNVSVYVTSSGNNVNEPIDFQCGGSHAVSKSYFEMYGQASGNDQFAFSKLNWGALGASGCQSTAPPTEDITFDKSIFVYDGPTNGNFLDPVTGRHKIVACLSARDGNTCGGSVGHIPGCITNSQIIDNSTDQTDLLEAGPAVAVDTGCTGSGADTNTYYQSATARSSLLCGVAPNWPSDGHGCVFPYVPQYLTDNDTHESLVAAAHAAGQCGEGTMDDPIALCPEIALSGLGAPL